MANGLLAMGLKPGDRVAVLEENCLEASDFFLGTAIANLVRVPMYKRNAPEAHTHMVRHTGCKALVVSAAHEDETTHLKAQAPELETLFVRDSGYEAWLAAQSAEDPNVDIDLDDFYVIRHSGGTTGYPKGMAFSHRAWMNTERDWTYRLPPIEPGDCAIHVAPISHGSGYLFVPIWMMGGTNVLEPKFDGPRTLSLLAEFGGYFFAVPTMISDLVAEGEKTPSDFSRMKAIVIGGSPILPQTALKARTMFGHCLHQMYGETEATPAAWMTPNEWFTDIDGSEPLLAAGRVLPFVRMEVRDEDNKAVGPGETGRVAILNDGQMQCIWNEPEMSKERVVDGWVLTGDIGRIDANGYLYLTDRRDDMIISGGFNIWPAELELAISTLDDVKEVVVVRGMHPRWGETPIAVVVVDEKHQLTEDAVIAVCNDKLGAMKRPSKVHFRHEALPRSPVGKVQRTVVRSLYAETESALGGS